MITQQKTENPDKLGGIIDQLLQSTTINPPLNFRSDINISTPEILTNRDKENYRTRNYEFDDIIYHLEFKSMELKSMNDGKIVCLYTFNYQSFVPKSQQKNFEVWVTNDFGAKLLKTKSSTTRIEIYLEPITLKKENNQETKNNNDNNNSSGKVTAKVSLGLVSGSFKVRYSNIVTIELLVKYN